ncbi:uncharacterized protein [Rutidosis leptorrhynchoides]|uniref:uncharacterized protein n=1 Tax=Rutidosis leptorrhynchoides TaxID=125765 RepID=UPI003A995B95
MASTSRVLSAIVVLSLLNCFNAVPSKLVQTFCGKLTNPNSCLSALQPDPKSATVSSYHDLATITLNLGVSNTTKSKNFLESSKGKYNPNAVDECIKGFTYAIGTLGTALKEIDDDPESAGYDAAVAKDGADRCVAAFKSANIQVPPEISSRVGYVQLYAYLGNMVTENL